LASLFYPANRRVSVRSRLILPFDSVKGEGATGYLLGGIGNYRKRFASPESPVTYLYFDGVYNNATVTLNGKELGFHPYGYAPFYYDISDELKPAGGQNELKVRVDHSRYTTPKVSEASAIVRVETILKNKGAGPQDAKLVTELVSPLGDIFAIQESAVQLEAGEEQTVVQEFTRGEVCRKNQP